MKIIMELSTKKIVPGLRADLVRDLEQKGVADLKLLEHVWGNLVYSYAKIGHLCLMLQAYCLIYPIAAAAETPGAERPAQKYIIPCKLPEPDSCEKLPKWLAVCAKFYFDFDKFLPDEIYHRLICLAIKESKPPRMRDPSPYSKKRCIFYCLHEKNWVIEIERQLQRLKISVT